jgi:hypothetical protein
MHSCERVNGSVRNSESGCGGAVLADRAHPDAATGSVHRDAQTAELLDRFVQDALDHGGHHAWAADPRLDPLRREVLAVEPEQVGVSSCEVQVAVVIDELVHVRP